MTSTDTMTNNDITDLILREHAAFRTQFTSLLDMREFGWDVKRDDAWKSLSELLEVHAKAEEEILYPVLLKRGSNDAEAETVDAVADHNEIRDAIKLATRSAAGTDEWWGAVQTCSQANDDHLAEEERNVIPDVRKHSSPVLRSELGLRWMAFHAQHRAARGISNADVNPDEFVRENS